jgi:hypothetical protein
MLRLLLIWVALERWLPESRVARRVALALAAVLPSSAHLDGMITNETLLMLLSAASSSWRRRRSRPRARGASSRCSASRCCSGWR